jgi:magnesium transporter
MLHAFIRFGDGRIVSESDEATLAQALRDPQAVFWLDMSAPTDEQYALLDEVFGFHPLAIEDSIAYSQRPKIESYNHVGDACKQGYFYMVIHGPDLADFRENLRTKELDIFMSQRYLVTIHDEPHKSIDDLLNRARHDPHLVLDQGIDLLLHNILDHLVDNYTPILDYIQETIDELEEKAVAEPTPDLLGRIAIKKRELLNLRRIIGPQREVVAQLTRGEVPFIRESTRIYLRDVQDHLIRAVEMIELYRDLVIGARDIYMSSVSNNLNQIMKTLTMITVIALPLTVVTSFFGMNFQGIPVWDWVLTNPAGFIGAMVFVFSWIFGLVLLFRINRWI